ncbi:hypothetical protein BZA77DRAFT_376156, partial [Pyronema omphalodes]
TDPSHRNIWRRVILNGWTSQFVTICTAIIRTCMNIQMLIACLMLATLGLEFEQIDDKYVEKVKVYAQHAAGGPFDIAIPFFAGAKVKSFRQAMLLLAVAILAIESTMGQFMSTILLSDLSLMLLQEKNGQNSTRNYTFAPGWEYFDNQANILLTGADSHTSMTGEFSIFAEHVYSDRIAHSLNKSAPGFVDSGNVTRAFLPIRKPDDINVAQYSGPARILSTRIMCFAPRFYNFSARFNLRQNRSSLQIDQSLGTNRSVLDSHLYLNFTGHIELNLNDFPPISKDIRNSIFGPNNVLSFAPFRAVDCLPAMQMHNLCNVTVTSTGAPRPESAGPLAPDWVLVTLPSFDHPPKSSAVPYLFDDAHSVELALPTNDQIPERVSNNGSEWTDLFFAPGEYSINIKSSLCASIIIYSTADVMADGQSNYSEPEVDWIKKSESAAAISGDYFGYDTTGIEKQLAVLSRDRPSQHERQILDLSSITPYPVVNNMSIKTIRWSQEIPNPKLGAEYSVREILTSLVDDLFYNVITHSGDLSLAWEAVIVALFSTHHERNLRFYNEKGLGEVKLFKEYLVPRRYLGFWIAMAVVALHFAILGVVAGAYSRKGTLLGSEDAVDLKRIKSDPE